MTTSPAIDPADLIMQSDRTFRIHQKAYTEPHIFDLEMARIFGSTWVYVAHESQISHAGAYTTSYVGTQPVIVSRGEDGSINVMLNRCRHRGSVVCREVKGTANYFRCPYHGWVYSSTGSLIGVSRRKGAYPDDWDQPDGLVKLPRVEVIRGLIFASFNPDVEDLTTHLGTVAGWLDRKFGLSPEGRIELTSDPFVVTYKANWKFAVENIIDNYHFTFVHEPFMKLQARYGATTGDYGAHETGSTVDQRKRRFSSQQVGTSTGHVVSGRQSTEEELAEHLTGENGKYFAGLLDKHGDEKLRWMLRGGTSMIYPNLGIIHHQLRVIRPIAPDLTEVTVYPYDLVGAPDAYNQGWLHSQVRFYGPAGYGMPDDVEMFALNQQGLQASAAEWLLVERGLDNETILDNQDRQGSGPAPETTIRAQWRRWTELMTTPRGAGHDE